MHVSLSQTGKGSSQLVAYLPWSNSNSLLESGHSPEDQLAKSRQEEENTEGSNGDSLVGVESISVLRLKASKSENC
jgi:hypothetical protein